jgi:hypothetical protein
VDMTATVTELPKPCDSRPGKNLELSPSRPREH